MEKNKISMILACMLFVFILILSAFVAPVCAATEITPVDLRFTPAGGGKYIYCNSEEAILRKDLSDVTNPDPSYIMNNDNLQAGLYSMFISHANYTDRFEFASKAELWTDIELDVQFVAKEDTTIKLTAVGFETQKFRTYIKNGEQYRKRTTWDLANAWADYMQLPIYTLNMDDFFLPNRFTARTISLKAGEEIWLSKYIRNYSVTSFLMPVQILADFEIVKGAADVNVAALRHNGTLGDRSHHSKQAKRGVFSRDRQYKGIADTLPAVDAFFEYTIDDTVKFNTFLPVTVYNQYVPEGNTVTKWATHINPQADPWSRDRCAESDMLAFKYNDGTKSSFYRGNVPMEARSDIWIFDVFHSDTKTSAVRTPNYLLTTAKENTTIACNLGNYGVSSNYNVTIHNSGEKTRYFQYRLETTATNLITVLDSEGNTINDAVIRKAPVDKSLEEIMASVELPPNETTVFTIKVILPANRRGGMQNSFLITDTKQKINISDSDIVDVTEPFRFTGREYIKWQDANLYISDEGEEWSEKPVSPETHAIFEGQWNNFEVKYISGNLIEKVITEDVNVGETNADDVNAGEVKAIAAKANSTVKASEVNMAEENMAETDMPEVDADDDSIDEESLDSISLQDEIRDEDIVFLDEEDSNYLDEERSEDDYIDAEYTDGVYVVRLNPFDGMPDYQKSYFQFLDRVHYLDEDFNYITTHYYNGYPLTVRKTDGKIEIDTAEGATFKTTIPSLERIVAVRLNGKRLRFDVDPVVEEGRTLIPVRAIFEHLNAEVSWDDETKTATIIKDELSMSFTIDENMVLINEEPIELDVPARLVKDRTMIPLRFLSEELGYTVSWDGATSIVDIDL